MAVQRSGSAETFGYRTSGATRRGLASSLIATDANVSLVTFACSRVWTRAEIFADLR